MKRYAYAAFALTAAFGLVACGDETTNNNYSTVAIEDYTLKTLPKCDSTMEGQVGFVTTTAELMYCMNGEWKNLNGANGAPGDSGAPGNPGDPGENCTAKQLNDKSGYKIICGKDSVGVVLNGEKGKPGKPGDPGESCKMTKVTDMGDTVAMVTCKKDTVWLRNGKNADGTTADGNGTGTGTDPYQGGQNSGDQTTLSEGSMPNGLVIIGNQVWAGQNVNDASKGGTCYNNNDELCAIFGRLYTWAEAMALDTSYNHISAGIKTTKKDYQGICPDGFHIPTVTDWSNLKSYINSLAVADSFRKANNIDYWRDVSGVLLRGTTYDGNGNSIWTTKSGTITAIDRFGFMAVGAGRGELIYEWNDDQEIDEPKYSYWDDNLTSAIFWTNQEQEGNEGELAYHVYMNYDAFSTVTDDSFYKNRAQSVRCIMNMSAQDYMKTDEYKALFETPETPAAGN